MGPCTIDRGFIPYKNRVSGLRNCKRFIKFESGLLTKGFSCGIMNNALSNQVKRMGTARAHGDSRGSVSKREGTREGKVTRGIFYLFRCFVNWSLASTTACRGLPGGKRPNKGQIPEFTVII
jgi:hypothetical protein